MKYQMLLDVVSSCNLRCPSCPIGNSTEARGPSGIMPPELLDRILQKATAECDLDWVALYNWTEPLLHPQLPEMIRTVRRHGSRALLSSNLNIMRDIDAVLLAEPHSLRISLSGFHQENYGQTHTRGQIDDVKTNMTELAQAIRRTRSRIKVQVAFHRYLGNHPDEALMREYAGSLGFEFHPEWAYLMPLEKNLAILGEESVGVLITDSDRKIVDRLVLKPEMAVKAALPAREQSCRLLDEQIVLDVAGNVMLCCTVYDRQKYALGNFLELPLADIQRLRRQHSLCGTCTKHALHVISKWGTPALEEAALAEVRAKYPNAEREGLQTQREKRRLRPRQIVRQVGQAAERVWRALTAASL